MYVPRWGRQVLQVRLGRLIRLVAFVAVVGLCFAAAGPAAKAAGKELVVFAAASTTDAVNEIGAVYKQKGLGEITCSYASSSTLAKQIEQGAPADVFLSANNKWMDYLGGKNLVAEGSRSDLLRNRIALVVPLNSDAAEFTIKEGADLRSLLGKDGRLAVGDPAHVPVGMYGKQALENLKIWESVKDRIAPAKDVRAGLALVERGEAPLGLVYSSDAAASEKVRVVGVFPESSHPAIVYPVGAIQGERTEDAKKFIAFLYSQEARAVFKKYGFDVI